MPILLPLDKLRPGMTLAGGIANQYSVLMPDGHCLTEKQIVLLQERVPGIYVKVFDPLLDEIALFQDTRQDEEVSLEIRRQISNASNKINQLIRNGEKVTSNHIEDLRNLVGKMLRYLDENRVAVAVIEQTFQWDTYLQGHVANVFYLSMVIGRTIRDYISEERNRLTAAKLKTSLNLMPLGIAAVVHDLGMVSLEKFYKKSEPLTDNELKELRKHPESGVSLLPHETDSMVKLIVRCHHENQNGTGYPKGLSGRKTNIFSRIIRVADAYTAAVSLDNYKQAKSPVRTLFEMVQGPYQESYDPVVLRVLTTLIPAFPVGSKVKLSTGEYAVVTRHNPKNTFMPQVIVAFDKENKPYTKDQLKPPFFLDEQTDLQIVSFGQEDISYLYDPKKLEMQWHSPLANDLDRAETLDPAWS